MTTVKCYCNGAVACKLYVFVFVCLHTTVCIKTIVGLGVALQSTCIPGTLLPHHHKSSPIVRLFVLRH